MCPGSPTGRSRVATSRSDHSTPARLEGNVKTCGNRVCVLYLSSTYSSFAPAIFLEYSLSASRMTKSEGAEGTVPKCSTLTSHSRRGPEESSLMEQIIVYCTVVFQFVVSLSILTRLHGTLDSTVDPTFLQGRAAATPSSASPATAPA